MIDDYIQKHDCNLLTKKGRARGEALIGFDEKKKKKKKRWKTNPPNETTPEQISWYGRNKKSLLDKINNAKVKKNPYIVNQNEAKWKGKNSSRSTQRQKRDVEVI
jgi:hypothetical protein